MKSIALIILLGILPFATFSQLTINETHGGTTCFGSCNGFINLSASGGTAPYTFWTSGPSGYSSNVTNPVNLCSGTYSVTVTDALSATATATINITQPTALSCSVTATTNVTCNGIPDGSATIIASGGTPGYIYLWPTGSTSQTAFGLSAGIYSVTVMDANACTCLASVMISEPPLIILDMSVNNAQCGLSNGAASVSVAGGQPPYTYLWNDINTTTFSSINNLTPGTYTVVVTDANGCTSVNTATILNSAAQVGLGNDYTLCTGTCDTINPSIFNGTPPYSYIWNDMSSDTMLVICPSNTGNYFVTVTDALGCSASDTIIVSVVNNCNTISGFVYNDANNNGIWDIGEVGKPNIILSITPGPNFISTDANGNYSAWTDIGSYSISIASNLPPNFTVSPLNQTAVFTGSGQTDSGNDFGIFEAPANNLMIYGDHSNMRPGFSFQYFLCYQNMGTTSPNTNIKLVLDSSITFVSAFPVPNSHIGDTVTWEFPNLQANTSGYIYLYCHLPTNVPIGQTLTSTAIIDPIALDIYPNDNTDIISGIVTGSYDPNDKAVSPDGIITPEQVLAGDYLEYTIRFQNTGTDTAFNIVVIDTLSQNLNISSFENLVTSHPCTWQIHGAGILTWTFSNILLPDSNINEPKSHGLINYRIKPLQTLQINDQIENNADIFFDFNLPVKTNTVVSTVDNLQAVIEGKTEYTDKCYIYPNPTSQSSTLVYQIEKAGDVVVRISDFTGRSVVTDHVGFKSKGMNQSIIKFDRPGYYLIQLSTPDGDYTVKAISIF